MLLHRNRNRDRRFDLHPVILYTRSNCSIGTAILDIALTLHGINFMADPKSPIYSRNQDRRSVFNRRWIKSDYKGRERRGEKDRREGLSTRDLPVPADFDSKNRTGLEKLLVSNTVQLEALTRILLDKGYIREDELLEMMNGIQAEYQSKGDKR